MNSNINLYLKTEYSLLSSMIRIDSLPQTLKQLGYNVCAICDDQMYGVLKFYNVCVNNNIKPIIGLSVTFKNENYDSTLLLYAMNNVGYKNLLKISTLKNLKKDTFSLNDLNGLTYGVLCVIPSLENEVVKYFVNKSIEKSINILNTYKYLFNKVYLGIDLQREVSHVLINNLIDFASKNNIKCVALNKTCYYDDSDVNVYKALKSILLNTKNYELQEEEYKMSFLSNSEMELLFNNHKGLLYNLDEINNLCNVSIKFDGYKFPKYDIENSSLYLQDLCKLGLNKRLKQKQEKFDYDVYVKRLNYELEIINKMGFCDYFLIVFDYVRYAKNNDICVGPGRGSAGGSLVSYCLGITEIDPIKYNLLFERFLNPERISMPDIDVDFPDDRRDEVIRYIGSRFGVDRVAHINTFGTLKPRLAIRDVARVTNFSELKLKEIMKFIPQASNMSLNEIINDSLYLQRLINSDDEIANLMGIALKIENLPRNCSTHAAGIIMADSALVDYTPLQEGINGLYQTQFEASDLEMMGLVKMDVLGIRNLSIIKKVINDVKKTKGIDVKINNIPFDDPRVMELLRKGDTLGLFQLESDGVRKLLIDMKCSSLNDIVNATSLYRPGPMEMIPTFIKRKFGEKYELIHPDLKDILDETYGIIVFQEQIMLIARKFAGYTLGQADILRRAISKKKIELIKSERQKFIQNSIINGYPEDKAAEIYDYIEKFANYGFNKSHGVAYAIIAYQMAYLKTHYYKSFMCALMTNNIGSINSTMKYIMECKKHNIKVYTPNINVSTNEFVYDDNGLYYPLLGINNVGEVVVKEILDERKQGLFKDYDNFVSRTSDFINKKQFNNLVYSGALDCFKHSRKSMVNMYDLVLQKVNYIKSLGSSIIETEFSDEEYTFEEISFLEKEALGFNIKYSYFTKYQTIKVKYGCKDIANYDLKSINRSIVNVKYLKVIKTKKNEEMAFISMLDDSMEIDGVLFPSCYQKFKNMLEVNKSYLITYKIENREEKIQAVIDSIYNLN